jgi:hypothetical protein
MAGLSGQCLPVRIHRLRQSALRLQHNADAVMGIRAIGVQLEDTLKARQRFILSAALIEQRTQHIQRIHRIGMVLQDLAIQMLGFGQPSCLVILNSRGKEV